MGSAPSRTSGAAYGVTTGAVTVTSADFGQPRGAEVGQDDSAAALTHHVLRFDVAVDEAGPVDRRQRAAEIDRDEQGFLGAERS